MKIIFIFFCFISFNSFAEEIFLYKNKNFFIPYNNSLININNIENFYNYNFKNPKIYFPKEYKDITPKDKIDKNKYVLWNTLIFESNDLSKKDFSFKIETNNSFLNDKLIKKFHHNVKETSLKTIFRHNSFLNEKKNKYFISSDKYIPVFSEDDNSAIIQYKSDIYIDNNYFLMSYPDFLDFQKLNIRLTINNEVHTIFDDQFTTINLGKIHEKNYFLFSLNKFIQDFNLENKEIIVTEFIYFFKNDKNFKKKIKNQDSFELLIQEIDNKDHYHNFNNYFEYFIFNLYNHNFVLFNNFDFIYSFEMLSKNFNISNFESNDQSIDFHFKNLGSIEYFDNYIYLPFDLSFSEIREFILNHFNTNSDIYITSQELLSEEYQIKTIKNNQSSLFNLILKISKYFWGTFAFICFYFISLYVLSNFVFKFLNKLNSFAFYNYLFIFFLFTKIILVIIYLSLIVIKPHWREINIIIGNIIFLIYFLFFMFFTGMYIFNKTNRN